ncbi:MAG: hypothetical protein ACRCWM_06630 [Sarcina sp.]
MRDFMSISSVPKIYEPRKLSEAFDFKKGQRLEGNIKEIIDGKNSVTLKLKDGTEIVAKLDIPLEDIIEGLTKFEVVGFDKGQVKLKVLNEEAQKQQTKTLNDSLELLLNKFGLEIDKKQILEKMLKFNIQMTKENIELLNTLTEFRDKALTNPKDIKGFIDSYIASKGNEVLLEQKQVVESKLNEFFKSFSEMSDNDILAFLENDIEINTTNVKSFLNITKENGGVFNSLRNATEDIQNLEEDANFFSSIKNNGELISTNKEKISRNAILADNDTEVSIEKNLDGKLENQTFKDALVREKDITISKMEGNKINESLKKIDEQIKSVKTEVKSLVELGSGVLKNEAAKEVLKKLAANLNSISKEIPVSEKLTTVLDKVIKSFDNLDKRSLESLKNIFEFTKKEIVKLEQDFSVIVKEKLGGESSHSDKLQGKEIDMFLKDFKEVKMGLADKQEQMKEAIRMLADKVASNNEGASQMVMGVLKDKIADFKMFNDLSNEYYYLDVPLNMKDQEYPCKLVIKDDRKDGKKLDEKNIKLAVSVKTVNIGSVDALIKISDKNIKIELKVLKQNMNLLEKNKDSLHKALEQLSFMPYIFVSEKKEIVESSISDFREFFSDGNTLALDKKV